MIKIEFVLKICILNFFQNDKFSIFGNFLINPIFLKMVYKSKKDFSDLVLNIIK